MSKSDIRSKKRRLSRSFGKTKSRVRDQAATKNGVSQTGVRVTGRLQEPTAGIKEGIRRITEMVTGKVKGLSEKEFRQTLRKRRTSDGRKILDHITGKSKQMKRLVSEEEKALAAERLRWKQIEQRLAGLICSERIQKNRGESTADAVRRLIGSRTDEEIERMLYELESGAPV